MDRKEYQQVKKIFQSALDIAPAERAEFLDENCSDNPSIREEVEKLLSSFDSEYLEQPAVEKLAETIVAGNLSDGQKIGNYKIGKKIGAGGMGEVFFAEDTRLNRHVAIKILPADFALDKNRVRRFELEAKATSALNHPNILTVYDIGEYKGSPFIVTELLEGEELRQLLKQGALPIRKVIDYAQQFASGLTAAHEKGIVHRDLKPENLFITNDDRLKILDFGIAKLTEKINFGVGKTGENDSTLLQPETQSSKSKIQNQTAPGMVMGTVGYMSPEQVRGDVLDYRSDIFSFGLILYEMIRGKRAFDRETLAETMTAILKEEPEDLTETNPNINPALERIVRRCLEKKPERRFQSTADLGFALESLSAPSTASGKNLNAVVSTTTAETAKPKSSNLRWILGGLALLTLGVLAGIFAFGYFRQTTPLKFEQISFRRGLVNHARFSPDGQTIVYSAQWNGNPGEIFSTRGGLTESQSLGFKDADVLSVSSTGELAILTKRKYLGQLSYKGTLARVPIIGGTPREILEDVQEADWSPDGKELAVVRNVDGKNRLEYPIGKVLYETEGYITYPRISPKGDRIAFMNHSVLYDNRGTLEMVDLAGNKTALTEDLSGEEGVVWSLDGSEIWFTASKNSENYALYGITPTGKMREIYRAPSDLWIHDISRDGRSLMTRVKNSTDFVGLTAGDTNEKILPGFDSGGVDNLSADGKAFIFTNYGQSAGKDYSVYLGKTDGSSPVRLGEGQGHILSPDGKWVISELLSSSQVLVLPTGAGEAKKLDFQGIERNYDLIFGLPDSKQIIFNGNEAGKPKRTFIKNIETGAQRPISPEGVTASMVSPDGKIFICDETEKKSVCSVDGNTPPRPLAGFGDTDRISQWTADNRALYVFVYEDSKLKMWTLDVTTGHKEPFKEITIADKAGIFFRPYIIITPDGKSYIYHIRRYIMDLYLADGLK